MSKKKIWSIVVGILAIVFLAGITGASAYLYNFAFEPQKPLNSNIPAKKAKKLSVDKKWLSRVKQTRWNEISARQDLKLSAAYIPAKNETNKTIIVAHGYQENHKDMASYIRMFHELGYNVLAPDDRGAGQSQGKYIGFGWPDRLDYVKWIKQVIAKNGKNSEIGLFGVSMGGATVMMVSGEKLPKQVKAIVEDAGYSSIEDELTYELKARFNLPKEPLITTAAWYTNVAAGFNFKEGSSVKQLHKNKLPIYFIHGGKDTFVPTKMVYKNYSAVKGVKKIWVAEKAGHAMTFYDYPQEYQRRVSGFFAKYLK
ncbi:alpha/beta hydrolase [Liquorilactobacillus hordei]|uniref:alpha/beta hydrolase n=1 Tax=Liquorilactobacillus hordei TaxID=468911 RepID=UPI0039ED27EE